jgi:uncharacterized membrane protein
MAEPTSATARYIAELTVGLSGSRRDRARLCEEVRSHIEDALQGADSPGAESRVVEQLGTPQQITDAWASRCQTRRTRQRKRGALVAAAATASLLALAQHAQGGQASGRCEKPSPHQLHHPTPRTRCTD